MTIIRHGFTVALNIMMVASLLVGFAVSDGLAAQQKVDINTSTEAELARVPGISQELAALIVEYRETNGPIQSWDEVATLQQEAELRKLEKHLKVGDERGDN